MNKKLFMMALCIMGHSAYTVDSTAGQNNTNNLSEQAELGNLTDEQKEQAEKLDNAMQKMNTIKNRVLESEDLDLDELKAFRMQLGTINQLIQKSIPILVRSAKCRESLRMHAGVSRLLEDKRVPWEQKAWEGLTDEQRDQEKKKVDEAMKELMRQHLISRNLDELKARSWEVYYSLRDSNGVFPYSDVPEMSRKYQEYRNAADRVLSNFNDAQVQQWFALTDEQRDQEKRKMDEAMQTALNIERQVFAKQALTSQEWDELSRQLSGVNDALLGQDRSLPYYGVPEMKPKYDEFLKLRDNARKSLFEARGGWVPVKQTLEAQKLEQAKLDEKKRMMSKNDVKE